jgi:AcrR family transcriptional regulator
MLDTADINHRIIEATLRLAERRGWRDLTLADIAAEAGLTLIDLRDRFESKAAVLAAFSDSIDRDVLKKFAVQSADSPRDRLFDVILSRFETMMPYKAAIRRIVDEGGATLAQLGPALRSQYWMLTAAGINAEGTAGTLRVQGLLTLYARVFRTWLDDEDAGMARTMAVLDRRLRQAEASVARVERLRDGVMNVMHMFRGGGQTSAGSETDLSAMRPEPGTSVH